MASALIYLTAIFRSFSSRSYRKGLLLNIRLKQNEFPLGRMPSLNSFIRFQENRTSSAYSSYAYTRPIKDRREWRDVILPAVPAQPVGMQFMSYLIRGLEPGQQYEVKVQARNKFGWTLEDPSFTFKTTETGLFH